MSNEVCSDNRFEIIEAAKQELIRCTNIEMRPDEMSVIDSVLFRLWQMRWLPGQERTCTMEEDIWIPCEEDGCTRLSTPRWWCSECEDDSIGARPNYCPNCGAKVVR